MYTAAKAPFFASTGKYPHRISSDRFRRTALPNQLLARKSIDKLISDSEEPEHALKKTLGPWSLTALGIGAVIGSGIFTVIGTAISGEQFDTSSVLNTPLANYIITHTALAGRPGAGPAIALSLVLVAIVCALTGLCYAELASMIPIAGSAYTYTYATMGELIAWIIGWDLILEYAGSNMTRERGLCRACGGLCWTGSALHPSATWISPAYLPEGFQDLAGNWLYHPGWHFGFNIPAFLIVLMLTVILVRGIRESASTNNMMVGIKLIAILIFVSAAVSFIHPATGIRLCPTAGRRADRRVDHLFHLHRLRLGFHCGRRVRNPQRDLPIGIIATLVVCTVLYVAVAVCLTGLVPWQSMVGDARAGGECAEKTLGCCPGGHSLHWIRLVVLFGAIMGMLSSLLVYQLGPVARLVLDVARRAAAEGIQQRTPDFSHAGLFHVGCRICGCDSFGTVRYRHTGGSLKHRHAVRIRAGVNRRHCAKISRAGAPTRISRSGGPIIPALSVIFCFLLMAGLPIITWMRFLSGWGSGL